MSHSNVLAQPAAVASPLIQIDLSKARKEHVVALAGNPNTGKSTLFNNLTGLNQHTGNWPGKTVQRMEGRYVFESQTFKVVDLPGTYSLLSTSTDEEIARNYILFERPDVVVIMVDATAVERNLNLVLQILQITHRVIVCVNLMDEAARRGVKIQIDRLQNDLGVPVIATSARSGDGIPALRETIQRMASGRIHTSPFSIHYPAELSSAVDTLSDRLRRSFPGLSNTHWLALRLLDGDADIRNAVETRRLPGMTTVTSDADNIHEVLKAADEYSIRLQPVVDDILVKSLFDDASKIAGRSVVSKGHVPPIDVWLDRVLTSRLWGIPMMGLLLGLVFYLTIEGANVPSQMLAAGLFFVEERLDEVFRWMSAPEWVTGFFVHGVYRGLAWVVSVMLPPMAIFFPIFTFLEDLGYLPRVAFNLDRLFKWAGAHGKQALSMGMGFGCNAAGVISTRIIDSPRERLIAILTNNFVPCNGRWPTLIMLASLFVAASFPAGIASIAAAGTIAGVTIFGILVTLVVSRLFSRHTSLKGESSFFQIELPPYRRPSFLRIFYRSIIDRTALVLWRAIVMAAPAGGLCWILANTTIGNQSLFQHLSGMLEPIGRVIGLDGVILLAYLIAIPANEIVVPTIIMGYMAAGQMTELDSDIELKGLFIQNGWSTLTAVCLMFFSLLHYPCSTTTLTIWRETRSIKWTIVSNLMPLGLAFLVCGIIAFLFG
jgi:ferrous iron transport protein B